MLPFEQAAKALKQATSIGPDTAEVHFALGSAYCALSRWAQAIEAYRQAIRLRPDLYGARFGLGLCYLMVGENGLALEEYKTLKELDKNLADRLFTIIWGSEKDGPKAVGATTTSAIPYNLLTPKGPDHSCHTPVG